LVERYGFEINEPYIDKKRKNDLVSILSLDLGSYLNLFNAVIILGISIPTLYMSSRINVAPLKLLFVLFSIFLILHGLYHFSYFLGDLAESDLVGLLSNNVLEPASYLVLLGFVLYFAKRGG